MTIYLYVKQHSITGLKYFGRTTQANPLQSLRNGNALRRLNQDLSRLQV